MRVKFPQKTDFVVLAVLALLVLLMYKIFGFPV